MPSFSCNVPRKAFYSGAPSVNGTKGPRPTPLSLPRRVTKKEILVTGNSSLIFSFVAFHRIAAVDVNLGFSQESKEGEAVKVAFNQSTEPATTRLKPKAGIKHLHGDGEKQAIMASANRNKGLDGRNTSVFNMLKKRRQSPSSSAVSSLKTTEDPASLDAFQEEDFEPTEMDMTETEQNEESNSSLFYDDQAVIFPHKEIISEAVSDNNTASESKEEGEENEVGDDGLFTPEILVEMLHEANRPDAYSRRRYLKQPNRSLELEDLTEILSHINICEAADTDPRWDVIQELAYGNRDNGTPTQQRRKKQREEEEEMEEGMIILDARSSGSSRLAKLSENPHGEEEDTERYASRRTPERKLLRRAISGDSQSLSLGDLMGDPKDSLDGEADSVFTLEAQTYSVESSVTWFEGADITEIEISEDDLEAFFPSHSQGLDGGGDVDEEESTTGDSTPPPPPNAAILYTPPPVDAGLSLGEEDSLSRCYRRRRPRRYAESE
eukprot:scaffold1803_cov92-Amphora_coffeaeformis.AAC.82